MQLKIIVLLLVLPISNVIASWDDALKKNEKEINEDPNINIIKDKINDKRLYKKKFDFIVGLTCTSTIESNSVSTNDLYNITNKKIAQYLTNTIRDAKVKNLELFYDNDINKAKNESFSNVAKELSNICSELGIQNLYDLNSLKNTSEEQQQTIIDAFKKDGFNMLGDYKLIKQLLGDENICFIASKMILDYDTASNKDLYINDIFNKYFPKEKAINEIKNSNNIINNEDIFKDLRPETQSSVSSNNMITSFGIKGQLSYYINNTLYITAGIGFENCINQENVRVIPIKNLGFIPKDEQDNQVYQQGIYVKKGLITEPFFGIGYSNIQGTFAFELTLNDKIRKVTFDQKSVFDKVEEISNNIYKTYLANDDNDQSYRNNELSTHLKSYLPFTETKHIHFWNISLGFKQFFGRFGYGIQAQVGIPKLIENKTTIINMSTSSFSMGVSLMYKL